MLLLPNTYNQQASLAAYCRTGDISLAGEVDMERVIHYRRLVFNVIRDSLSSAYPLTRNLLTLEEWELLVKEFFTNHDCQATQIWKMPKELIAYIEAMGHPLLKKYIVLKELLWFEWLEIELYMQEDVRVVFSEEGNLRKDKIILNPEHKLQRYSFPVHLRKADEITLNEKGEYFLSIHRHPDSGKVLFTDLSPAFVRVLELLNELPRCLNELTEQIVYEFGVLDKASVKHQIKNFLESAFASKLLLGFTVD